MYKRSDWNHVRQKSSQTLYKNRLLQYQGTIVKQAAQL